MKQMGSKESSEKLMKYTPLAGAILIISGLLLLLDQRFMTKWISVSIPVAISVVLLGFGILKKSKWIIVIGLALLGMSGALFLIFGRVFHTTNQNLLGLSFLFNCVTWILIFTTIYLFTKSLPWWFLFIALICGALAYLFMTGNLGLLDFIFYLSIAIGAVFLLWGSISGNIGLIIPGALIVSSGAGVFYGWSNPEMPGGLQKTGIMLVWFSLGWGLIIVFSRFMHKKFVWWPLIPGGILLTVGSGLYIGGNPENALGFISNTGSIGLILVGAYLIFMKFGMKR